MRNYFWKDKYGNELTFKQFMKRWKEGVEGINPYQQKKSQMMGIIIIVLGILCGIVMVILAVKTLWWLGIILLGTLFNSCVQYIGLKQQARQLAPFYKKVEIPEVNYEEKNERRFKKNAKKTFKR